MPTLQFEEWETENVYDYETNCVGESRRILVEIIKKGSQPLRLVSIDQQTADVLNAQAENLGRKYFPVIP